jgi:hypothetical protein
VLGGTATSSRGMTGRYACGAAGSKEPEASQTPSTIRISRSTAPLRMERTS